MARWGTFKRSKLALESAIISEQFTGFKTRSNNPFRCSREKAAGETATFNAGTLPAGLKVQVDGFHITLK